MEIEPINYYGFDHKAVNKHFTGGLTFIDTISIGGTPIAIYKVKNPDKKKGHKKYMGLFKNAGVMYATGYTPDKLKEYASRTIVQCLDCDKIIQSVGRHNYVECGCPSGAMIDGGDVYTRLGGNNIMTYRFDVVKRKIL